jgi:uncharacterized protein YuzE
MKIKYFEDTDTAFIEFGNAVPAETREVSENVYVDMDASGHVVSITLEHASLRSDFSEVNFLRMRGERAIVAQSL